MIFMIKRYVDRYVFGAISTILLVKSLTSFTTVDVRADEFTLDNKSSAPRIIAVVTPHDTKYTLHVQTRSNDIFYEPRLTTSVTFGF